MKLIPAMILALLMGYAVPSNSSDWYLIPGTDMQGDWSRIRVDNSGNVHIWIKSVLSPEAIAQLRDPKYDDYESSKALWIVNCKQEAMAIVQGIAYGAKGRVITSYNQPATFVSVVPDSHGENVLKAVCAAAR